MLYFFCMTSMHWILFFFSFDIFWCINLSKKSHCIRECFIKFKKIMEIIYNYWANRALNFKPYTLFYHQTQSVSWNSILWRSRKKHTRKNEEIRKKRWKTYNILYIYLRPTLVLNVQLWFLIQNKNKLINLRGEKTNLNSENIIISIITCNISHIWILLTQLIQMPIRKWGKQYRTKNWRNRGKTIKSVLKIIIFLNKSFFKKKLQSIVNEKKSATTQSRAKPMKKGFGKLEKRTIIFYA